MKDECLICKAPLEYPEKDEPMELFYQPYERKQKDPMLCIECHTAGTDPIFRGKTLIRFSVYGGK